MIPGLKNCAILYVDDETQALKYFKKAFEGDFEILTAGSAGEARKVLQESRVPVGMVISDQRMPGESGVSLLGELRQSRPEILRVLTTAYAEIQDAIQAVNSGAVYKYVVKPWDLQDLRVLLMRGLEYFLLQKERDALLREKLTVLQRLLVTDRVRSLSFMAAGLAHHIRNSMTALKAFLDLAPQRLREEVPDAQTLRNPVFWSDFWLQAEAESHKILKMVHEVVSTVITPRYAFADSPSLDTLVGYALDQPALRTLAASGRVEVKVSPGLPPLKADAGMLQRLLEILLTRLKELGKPGGRIFVQVQPGPEVWGTAGLRLRLRCEGKAWDPDMLFQLFTPLCSPGENPKDWGLDLLSAFFIAIHHGGDIAPLAAPPEGPGFDVLLPLDPEASRRPAMEEAAIKEILTRFGGPA